MAIINSGIITNKAVCKIWQSILYFTFLLSEFIDVVLVKSVDIKYL